MLNLHIYLIYSGKDMDAYPLIREFFFFFFKLFLPFSLHPFTHPIFTECLLGGRDFLMPEGKYSKFLSK